MSSEPDRYAVACNYMEPTSACSTGAKVYVDLVYLGGNLPETVMVCARSRGGRWIRKWESTRHLGNYRIVTIPPAHPMYTNAGERHVAGSREQAERVMERLDRLGVTGIVQR